MPWKLLLDLFLSFSKIGLFTFGGGYAMLSLIENACVEQKHWITHDDMMNITVVAESTPGSIAVNCATFVGYQQAGIAGALLATVGVVFPSFVIILALSSVLDTFLAVPLVANAFLGIKLAVGLLILNAGINMLKKMKKQPKPVILMIVALAVMLLTEIFSLNFSSVTLMLLCGFVSLALFLCHRKENDPC